MTGQAIITFDDKRTPSNTETGPVDQSVSVEVSNVTFAYSRFDDPVFSNLNLKVSAGECVAIVGPSGCGKSTLANLLIGALVPQNGNIMIGGRVVTEDDKNGILSSTSTIMQRDHILTESIRANIDFFRGFGNSEIEKAAKLADIDVFINSLPMRYLTQISDEFVGLSGGQRQRILIARALCGNPKLLIMDEATSYLDHSSERRISENIRSMTITRIIFAHRQETIQTADRIIKLQDLL